MSSPGQTTLLAIRLRPTLAAPAIRAAWDAGEAVLPLNPSAPEAEIERLLDRLRPTDLLDVDGRRDLPEGIGVPTGTAAVIATSGTTGEPRGVELTRTGLDAMGHGVSQALDVTPADRWLACLPFHHVAGLAILARAMTTGNPVTVHDRFDLDAVARSARDDGITIVSLVPTTLFRMLEAESPIEQFRRIVVGGAPTPPAVRARADARGANVIGTYGLSETWGGCVLEGRAIRGLEVQLAPDDDEVLLRGPMVTSGYRLSPEDTAAAFTDDGWFCTGDIGAFDGDGTLRIVDRKRDLIISGGVNVSPTEVEHVLVEHPAVADVCVIGVPDDEWGERVVAHVVPADQHAPPSLDALREFAREQLAPPKLPRTLEIVDRIPRSPGGKPLRRRMRPQR